MNFTTQMRIGLGSIVFLVVLLGIIANYQANSIWEETKGLYEHPLMVRRAVGNIKKNILSIHIEMKDFVLSKNAEERCRTTTELESAPAAVALGSVVDARFRRAWESVRAPSALPHPGTRSKWRTHNRRCAAP